MVGERDPLTRLWLVKLGDKPNQVDTNHQTLSLHPLSKPLFALGAIPPQFTILPHRIAFIMQFCFFLSSPRSATHLMLDISTHGLNLHPPWCENIHHNLTQ